MTEWNLSPQWEDEIRAAVAVPQPPVEFVNALDRQLMQQAAQLEKARKPGRPLRLAWAIPLAVLLVLAVVIWIAGPQRVVAAVRSLLGYVPGMGYVQPGSQGLRVISTPAAQTRDGITLTVEQGIVDTQRTYLVFQVDGIQQTQRPSSEDNPGCPDQPQLLLSDGTRLNPSDGNGDGWPTGYRTHVYFPAVPANVDRFTLVLPCLMDTQAGAAPEDWQIPLQLVAAPANLDVRAVIEYSTPTPPPTPAEASQPTAAPTDSATLAVTATPDPHGFQLSLEKLVDLEDGYLLQGKFTWTDPEISNIYSGFTGITLTDAAGQQVPVEYVPSGMTAGQYLDWALQTNTRALKSPLTVSVPGISVAKSTDVSFDVDLGAQPQPGQTWELNRDVEVSGYSVRLLTANMTLRADGTYWLEINYQFDPEKVAGISLNDPDNHSERNSTASGPASPDQNGQPTWMFSLAYSYLPEGVRHIQINSLTYIIPGPWSVEAPLPESSLTAPTPIPQPQPCFSSAQWEQMKDGFPTQIPDGLSGRLLVSGPALEGKTFPALYVMNLDGSGKTLVESGGWASLSADGTKVIYTYRDGMHLADLLSGQNSLLAWAQENAYSPLWSPDGARIAFVNNGIYTAQPDGSGMAKVPGTGAATQLVGWLPDGAHLLVVSQGADGAQLQTLALDTGATENHLLINNAKGGFASVSPDGQRVVYHEKVFGLMNYGIFISDLAGKNPRQLVQPGENPLTVSAWSPDGRWVALSESVQMDAFTIHQTAYLLQTDTCQAVRLAGVDGEVIGWSQAAP